MFGTRAPSPRWPKGGSGVRHKHYPRISVDRAHMNTPARLTGMKICLNSRLAASVAVFWLICPIFHFQSRPFSCSNKVTRVDKATARGTIEISSRGAILHLYSRRLAPFVSRLTGMKFLMWTHDRADPVDRVKCQFGRNKLERVRLF